MDGILNVYKNKGMTSFDVVRKIKKIANTKKVGHTGTLDPLAEGVLPICIGKATKCVENLTTNNKIYAAKLKLGVITETYDREGKIIEENEFQLDDEEFIRDIIMNFQGEIEQIPPIYSALKVNGKKLYEYARQGIDVEIKPRKVTIYYIDIKKIELPYIDFEVRCSKGTYIRSLCYDIGKALKCGATMWELERISSGIFSKENSVNIDKLDEDNICNHLINIEDIFMDCPKLTLDEKFYKLVVNGVCVKDKRLLLKIQSDEIHRVYDYNNNFIGIGKMVDGGFKLEKQFN